MRDKAHWAREGERTRLHEPRAINFVGMFLEWCSENTQDLPPGIPPFIPLRLHHSSVRAEDVSRADFKSACEAIAWLIEATVQQVPSQNSQPLIMMDFKQWVTPKGYVGRKEIYLDARFTKKGKKPSPTTIDSWVRADARKGTPVVIKQDPASRENYYPEDWIMKQIAIWSPRKPKS